MARSLLLMRHAKSDWHDSSLHDKDRPLNARGRATAPLMANWLSSNQLLPDLIVCSSAVRTRQTLELMLQQWTEHFANDLSAVMPETVIEDRLYLATDSTILSVVTGQPNLAGKQHILVLGHNPGMEVLASRLSEQHVEMPTAAIAIFDCIEPRETWPESWHETKMWKSRGLVKPKELGE